MFNFTTQTVYNSVEVKTLTANDRTVGKANVIINPSGKRGPELRIGNTRFNKDNVLDIQVKKFTPESLATVTFDLAKVASLVEEVPGIYRFAIYVGLSMNNQDALYANDFVYKGKPLYVEFMIKNATPTADDAKRVVANTKKFMLMTMGENILNVTADGTNVTFTATNGYQILKAVVLQRYDEKAKTVDCCSNQGEFVDVITGVPAIFTRDDEGKIVAGDKYMDSEGNEVSPTDSEVLITPGAEAFGDYNWIIHNLRLPTLANTNFWSTTKNEMPVVGGEYDQIIVRMCKERDGIAGGALGMRVTTVTTHVFYVNKADSSKITQAFTTIGVTKQYTDADTELDAPYDTDGIGKADAMGEVHD